MNVNEIKESLKNFSDDDLNSLITAIREQSNKRKKERIKTAFEAFKDAAKNLDKTFDDADYDFDGEPYTMETIIDCIRLSIQYEGYDI